MRRIQVSLEPPTISVCFCIFMLYCFERQPSHVGYRHPGYSYCRSEIRNTRSPLRECANGKGRDRQCTGVCHRLPQTGDCADGGDSTNFRTNGLRLLQRQWLTCFRALQISISSSSWDASQIWVQNESDWTNALFEHDLGRISRIQTQFLDIYAIFGNTSNFYIDTLSMSRSPQKQNTTIIMCRRLSYSYIGHETLIRMSYVIPHKDAKIPVFWPSFLVTAFTRYWTFATDPHPL